jgi:hypothetical protein
MKSVYQPRIRTGVVTILLFIGLTRSISTAVRIYERGCLVTSGRFILTLKTRAMTIGRNSHHLVRTHQANSAGTQLLSGETKWSYLEGRITMTRVMRPMSTVSIRVVGHSLVQQSQTSHRSWIATLQLSMERRW